MRERLIEIIRKEFRQAFRDPRMRSMLFVPPLVQLIVFGYAANLDVEKARIAWMDQDHTPRSTDLIQAFTGSSRFEMVAYPANDAEVQALLDSNRVDAVVRVLPGFGRDIARGRSTAVQILINGTNSNTASIVANYATSIVARYSAGNRGAPALETESRVWFNADLRSRNYFVPGVVVNVIMLVTLMLTAMAIVREKEIGTMEQLMVTPIRPIELMLGKTLPFAAVGLVDTALVVTVAILLFHVPFRGSFLLLLVCAVLFLMTSLGAGLFISTISRTQQQAMMTTFLFFQPFFMLSGFAFPIRNMPAAIQVITYLNPMRYFMEIVRGLFLKGSGASVLWPQMLALGIFGAAVLSISALRFRKRLD
jgi:ABC-2 type transport system permease protein